MDKNIFDTNKLGEHRLGALVNGDYTNLAMLLIFGLAFLKGLRESKYRLKADQEGIELAPNEDENE